MTVDPHVGAAEPTPIELVRELREAVGLFSGAMPMSPQQAWDEAIAKALVLAAADAAERPIAQRLADALRSQEHRERTTGVGAGYCLRCFHRWPCKASVVLAEWDATQEATT